MEEKLPFSSDYSEKPLILLFSFFSFFFFFFSGFCSFLFNIFRDPNPPLLPPPPLSPSVCLQHTELLTPVNCLPPTPQSPVPSQSVSMEIPSQVVRRHWHNHGNSCQWGWAKLPSNLQKIGRDGEKAAYMWRSRPCIPARPNRSLRLDPPPTHTHRQHPTLAWHWLKCTVGHVDSDVSLSCVTKRQFPIRIFKTNRALLNKYCYVGLVHTKDP